MISRILKQKLMSWAQQYPVITVTGPRQSGKTTLCRSVFNDKAYVSLEDLDRRGFAKNDPRGFLAQFPEGAVIDEIQYVPDLVSYIQTDVDQRNEPGRYILTGSRQFEMMTSVAQSLAGRTAVARLFPFTMEEIYGDATKELDDVLYTGFYPRIHDKGLNPTEAMSFYASTYIERDVRQLLSVVDLGRFEAFLKLCAGRVGQLLNMNSLGNDCGITHNTIKSWLSVLEASGIIKLLRPWSVNIGKRIVKTPKLYFLDTGLVCYLLGIHDVSHLQQHPLRGHLFENLIISDVYKQRCNAGLSDNLYFYRDNNGCEVDLLLENGNSLDAIEIKSSMTFSPDFLKNLKRFSGYTDREVLQKIIYGGDESYVRNETDVMSWRKLQIP
jgi:predicted AAA+ superfamily ATPase